MTITLQFCNCFKCPSVLLINLKNFSILHDCPLKISYLLIDLTEADMSINILTIELNSFLIVLDRVFVLLQIIIRRC